MKRKLLSLLSAVLCLAVMPIFSVCAADEIPEADVNPNTAENAPANPTREDAAKYTFEADGRILETSQPLSAARKVKIPIRVVDDKGNPVQNAGIACCETDQILTTNDYVLRERPILGRSRVTLTDYNGKATVSYSTAYSQGTIIVLGPDELVSCMGKVTYAGQYPACVRLDVDFPAEGDITNEITVTLPASEKKETAGSGFTYSATLRRNGKHAVNYLVSIKKRNSATYAQNEYPTLPIELLTNSKGKVTFTNLEAGTWDVEVYEYSNLYDENGRRRTPIKTYSFTLSKDRPTRKAIYALPKE